VKPEPQPNYIQQISGDILSKTNVFRLIREFARYSGINDGYYMEFGIMNGESAISAYRQLRGVVKHIYGFDTFAGHPAQSDEDKTAAEYAPYFFEGNYKSVDIEVVREYMLGATMLEKSNIHLTQGLFSDSLPKFDKSQLDDKGFPVCVFVDCDLYSSAKDVLNFITDIVRTGTWLLVDDYWCYRGDPKAGVRRALDEWVRDNGRVGITLYDNFNAYSRAYIVHEL
jgi:O-methyltransferase